MLDIKITKTTTPKVKPEDSPKMSFGKISTDHMFLMDYDIDKGWYDPRIVPYGPIALDPSSTVFHYGAEIFEGMKAYRRADGEVQFFRPMCSLLVLLHRQMLPMNVLVITQ